MNTLTKILNSKTTLALITISFIVSLTSGCGTNTDTNITATDAQLQSLAANTTTEFSLSWGLDTI